MTLPGIVTSIGDEAFANCGLALVFFTGNAPGVGQHAFYSLRYDGNVSRWFLEPATVYYLSGTTGWGATYGDLPTVMLNAPPQFGATGDGFEYLSDGVKVTITGYSGSNSVLTIPATITTLPVTRIGDYAFWRTALTSVTIPNSVTSIGYEAFANCPNLTNVTIGNGVTSIGQGAFQFTALTTVTIPDSVTTIENEAFEDCYNLANVTIGNSVTSIGDWAFSSASLTSVTIPDSVTSIGDWAFYDTALTSVTIPNSVTNVGFTAFDLCTRLASVTIGNGVTSIADGAFEGTALTGVTIPSGVTSIGDSAFYGCPELTSVFFMGNAPTADSYAFADDSATAYYLPGTLGWDDFSANTGVATALWFLPQPLILDQGPGFGVRSGQFGFTISWATNLPVVVEACTNLSNPVWLAVSTNTLVGGTAYFSDPQPANLPARFYRLRSP